MSASSFRLNPALDPNGLANEFRRRGRVHVPDFLDPAGAELLRQSLRSDRRWQLVINQGEKLFKLHRSEFEALPDEDKAKIMAAVHAAARHGFQYCYESIAVPDGAGARVADGTPPAAFAQFLSSEPVLELLRGVTGAADLGFADAQATAYAPGHFLTAHDDAVEGKRRRVAYVMGLTPAWRIEWGGLLMFHGAGGHVEEAWMPRFNALNLFAVPSAHSVSLVAPFAASRRYSVTGWLRATAPPA
jgi:hypothetical protein